MTIVSDWLAAVRRMTGREFPAPLVTRSPFQDDSYTCCEWWNGERKLTVYFIDDGDIEAYTTDPVRSYACEDVALGEPADLAEQLYWVFDGRKRAQGGNT